MHRRSFHSARSQHSSRAATQSSCRASPAPGTLTPAIGTGCSGVPRSKRPQFAQVRFGCLHLKSIIRSLRRSSCSSLRDLLYAAIAVCPFIHTTSDSSRNDSQSLCLPQSFRAWRSAGSESSPPPSPEVKKTPRAASSRSAAEPLKAKGTRPEADLDNEADDFDVLLLAETVHAIHGLILRRGVPPRVHLQCVSLRSDQFSTQTQLELDRVLPGRLCCPRSDSDRHRRP